MASLLLRLFHSDYFSPHLALSYLRTYSDNIGITYYLVSQLESAFPSQEVEFYWPQLCHLLITKPSESRALESFILRRCSQSVHVALLTLWYFQAALSDLSSNPHTASFQICHRVFNQCQRILFDDPLASSKPGYAIAASASAVPGPSNASASATVVLKRVLAAHGLGGERVSPYNPISNIVGIGSVIASAPGMPKLASISGTIAIEQARKKPDTMQGAFASRATDDDDDDDEHLGQRSRDTDDGSEETSEDESVGDTNHRAQPSGRDSAETSDKSRPAPPPPHARESSFTSLASSLAQKASIAMGRADSAPLPPPKDPPSKRSAPSVAKDEITSGGSLPTTDSTKKVENPFTTFAAGFNAGFNEFRDKAAAAVGEVFGQAQDGMTAAGASNGSGSGSAGGSHKVRSSAATKQPASGATKAPPPWSPQKQRQLTFGQQAALSRSVPNLASTRGTVASAFASSANVLDSAAKTEAILTLYDGEARSRLLRSNYCKVQTQFLLSLQDISARLLLIPKPARLSALRAELTALNHKLPADVCFPLWCTADDKDDKNHHASHQQANAATRHHRVVRINASEAVVLNSADRVPFLLHVEVLNNDLDFDPDRRQNRDTLRRLVTEEDARRRKTATSSGQPAFQAQDQANGQKEAQDLSTDASISGFVTPNQSTMASNATASPKIEAGDVSLTHSGQGTPKPASRPLTPSLERDTSMNRSDSQPPSRDTLSRDGLMPDEGEEMDLVEQAYGSDLAGFGEEKEVGSEDEDEQDLALRNRMHDTAAWSNAQQKEQPTEFSLDEYAQRMRTAAIMLSQLNKSTNASKSQAIINYGPNVSSNAQGGWSSWIIPTNWYGSSSSSSAAAGSSAANVNGSLGGGAGDKAEVGQGSAGVSTHMHSKTNMASAAAAMAGGNGRGSMSGVAAPMGGGNGAGGSSRLMYAETEAIRKRIMQEMMSLEEERMRRMKAGGRSISATRKRRSNTTASNPEDEEAVLRAVNKDDPSAAMFRESWASKKQRIRASSPYGHLANWDVFSVIVKTGADLRQEQLAVQLINEFGRIWKESGNRCWVRYFRILVTSENSGLMETITDAVSIHSIKKEAYSRMATEDKSANYTLYDHFLNTFGEPDSRSFKKAKQKFMESLAGYSIISYLLQIKDRHNGNILVDGEGRLIHIDFGFMLGISPGGVGFEAAPFKMPQEYIDILGAGSPAGVGAGAGAGIGGGEGFEEFKQVMRSGFKEVRKHAERIIMLVELMSKDSSLPCFALKELTATNLRDRFQLGLSSSQCDEFVDRLVLSSAGSAFTRLYDMYQRLTEGVL